jgi:hypothetical protein
MGLWLVSELSIRVRLSSSKYSKDKIRELVKEAIIYNIGKARKWVV